MLKNIDKAQALVLKNQVAYQQGQVVSKTLAQNQALSIHCFPLTRARESVLTSQREMLL